MDKLSFAQNYDQLVANFATRQRFGLNFFGMVLPNPDPILRRLEPARIDIYRSKVASDPHVRGAVKSRKAGVMRLNYGLEKGDAPSRPTKIIEDMLADLDMRRIISEMLDAGQYGYSPMEILWKYRGGMWLPDDIVGKPQEWFACDSDNNEWKFISLPNSIYGERLPYNKFVFCTQEATYIDPYGFPDLSCCFWPVSFKAGGMRFWVEFAEKWGQTFMVGKLPRTATEKEKDALLDDMYSMLRNAAAVIPNDGEIAPLESEGKQASSELFKDLRDACVDEINLAQLGHSAAAKATPGKLGAQDDAMAVRSDIIDADAKIVESGMNQVVRLAWQMNFPGRPPLWQMWAEEDVNKGTADRDAVLSDKLGVRFKATYISRVYSIPTEEFTIVKTGPIPVSADDPTDPGTAEFSAPVPDAVPGTTIDRSQPFTDAELQAQIAPIVGPLMDAIRGCTGFDQAMRKAIAAFPDMDADALVEAVSRAIFASNVYGRLTANDDATH